MWRFNLQWNRLFSDNVHFPIFVQNISLIVDDWNRPVEQEFARLMKFYAERTPTLYLRALDWLYFDEGWYNDKVRRREPAGSINLWPAWNWIGQKNDQVPLQFLTSVFPSSVSLACTLFGVSMTRTHRWRREKVEMVQEVVGCRQKQKKCAVPFFSEITEPAALCAWPILRNSFVGSFLENDQKTLERKLGKIFSNRIIW